MAGPSREAPGCPWGGACWPQALSLPVQVDGESGMGARRPRPPTSRPHRSCPTAGPLGAAPRAAASSLSETRPRSWPGPAQMAGTASAPPSRAPSVLRGAGGCDFPSLGTTPGPHRACQRPDVRHQNQAEEERSEKRVQTPPTGGGPGGCARRPLLRRLQNSKNPTRELEGRRARGLGQHGRHGHGRGHEEPLRTSPRGSHAPGPAERGGVSPGPRSRVASRSGPT